MPKKKAKTKPRSKAKPKKKIFPPDWKDSTAYPNEKTTTDKQWAWEFLRRNPEFQKDCKKLKSGQHEHFVHDPPFKTNESPAEYIRRTGSSPSRRVDIKSYLAKKWCVDNIREIDPEQTDYEKVKFRLVSSVDVVDLYDGLPQLSETEVLLSFDLSKPVTKPLIRDVGLILNEIRKALKKAGKLKDTRKQVTVYANYLRLLDAKDSKAKYSQMEEIFPQNHPDYYTADSLVKDGLKAAKRLRDHNYKTLLK